MHLFIKCSIFYSFWHSFGARVWDILSIWGNALMNHFFSIVISCKKAKNALWGFADPIPIFIKISIFYSFWHSFGARVWDIFSISGNALMNHFFSIVICKKAKNSSVRFCIRYPFSLKVQFFIIFGIALGPEFEISSQFQEMRLWITSSAS